jgi:hypothetical protein
MGLKGPRVALEKLQQFWIEADIYKNRKPQEHKDLNQHFFDVNNISLSYKLFYAFIFIILLVDCLKWL